MMVDFTKTVMVKDQDFGTIPGVGKPCLYKAGAEKLCTLFGFTPSFQLIERTEDWTGREHGEPFFYYFYKCVLSRDGFVIGEGDGSCNSFEKKYRYRSWQRKCPKCGAAAIFSSKQADSPGFYCWAKKDGCGAKFGLKDPAITSQEAGKMPNPDIAESVNTIQKMAQKRALIAAVLIASNASAFYTQDVEDMHAIDVEYEDVRETQPEVRERRLSEERAKRAPPPFNMTPEEIDPTGPVPDPDPSLEAMEKRYSDKVSGTKKEPKPRVKQSQPAVSFEMLGAFGEVKKMLHAETSSDALYYSVLGQAGYKKSSEIPDRDSGSQVYRMLVAALNSIKKTTADREEAEELARKLGPEKFWQFAGNEGIDAEALAAMTGEELGKFLVKLREVAA